MNVLVLGASSSIGNSIVKSFAKNNKLYLLSTKREKLEILKNEAIALGSLNVEIIEADLQHPINISALMPESIDMIINVACASSSLKNYNIEPHRHQYYTAVDLSSPLVILEHFLKEKSKQGKHTQLYYIFISLNKTKVHFLHYQNSYMLLTFVILIK